MGSLKVLTSNLKINSEIFLEKVPPVNLSIFENLKSLNDNYMRKFNIPFIIAVGGLNKNDIFKNMMERLENKYDQEFQTAINEIHKIAKIRLDKIT